MLKSRLEKVGNENPCLIIRMNLWKTDEKAISCYRRRTKESHFHCTTRKYNLEVRKFCYTQRVTYSINEK